MSAFSVWLREWPESCDGIVPDNPRLSSLNFVDWVRIPFELGVYANIADTAD